MNLDKQMDTHMLQHRSIGGRTMRAVGANAPVLGPMKFSIKSNMDLWDNLVSFLPSHHPILALYSDVFLHL